MDFRLATPADLKGVLAAYRLCFDATQRLRTVAHSPLLFRLYYARQMRRGKCQVALATLNGVVVGFAILREQAEPHQPWLLSAIGVVPSHRGGGTARRLFEMVATRPLILTVEEQGPVRFYEKLGLVRRGERTLIYLQRRNLGAFRALASERSGSSSPPQFQVLNTRTILARADSVTPDLVRRASRWLFVFKTAIVELPLRFEVASGTFPAVVHEITFATP